jgi:hypothetical protein
MDLVPFPEGISNGMGCKRPWDGGFDVASGAPYRIPLMWSLAAQQEQECFLMRDPYEAEHFL